MTGDYTYSYNPTMWTLDTNSSGTGTAWFVPTPTTYTVGTDTSITSDATSYWTMMYPSNPVSNNEEDKKLKALENEKKELKHRLKRKDKERLKSKRSLRKKCAQLETLGEKNKKVEQENELLRKAVRRLLEQNYGEGVYN